MSGSTSPFTTSSTAPTFFTGIAVSSSFLDAINDTVQADFATQVANVTAMLTQAQTDATNATTALTTAQQTSTTSAAALQTALTAALAQINALVGQITANAASAASVFANLPTSPTGLAAGQLWNNGGQISMVMP